MLVVLAAITAVLGSIALALITGETWALLLALFVIGASAIIGRLAWIHREPGLPWRIRRLGPLPPDPGLRKPPDTSGDPFRDS
ncbi:MAG: hypothetical protein H0V17_29845 [Deltaproteobacteria bacterium]|nr:hypothetical protein [Deltaproteobacteria bacterium]